MLEFGIKDLKDLLLLRYFVSPELKATIHSLFISSPLPQCAVQYAGLELPGDLGDIVAFGRLTSTHRRRRSQSRSTLSEVALLITGGEVSNNGSSITQDPLSN